MFELPPTFNPARRQLLGAGSALALGGLLPASAAAQVFTVRGQASGVSARTTRLRPVFLAW